MAEPSILGALRDPQFRSDTLRNLVEALNGAKRSLTVGSLGAVGDMGNTLANLVRAGAGTAYHEATGRPIPQALEYRDPARDFGTSASLGNFAERQGWLPPQTYSMPEQAGALLGPIAAMKAPDLAQSTLRGLVSALKSEPSRRMVEGLVDGMGARPKIFAGEGAQTADMRALAKAQQLEKAGAPERAIWSDTGWFRGADKKWRFEIDDSGASFIDKGFTTLPQGSVTSKNVNLGKQVDHQGLFEAYPKAAKMDAVITTNRGTGTGSYSNGLIEANGPNKSQAMGTTLHEIQHGVQDVEGFAKGGNSQMAYLNKEAFEVLADVRKRLSAPMSLDQYARSAGFSSPTEASASYADYVASLKKAPPTWLEHEIQRSAANEFYQRLAGEAEARAVQSRMDMTPEQRRATFPFDSYDVPRDKLILRDLLKGPAQSVYHRYTQGGPDNGAGYMMYADDPAKVENGYGRNHWTVDDAKLPPGSVIDADSPEFQKLARHALVRDHETTKQYWNGQRSFRDLVRDLVGDAAPRDIVNSAGLWDAPDLVDSVYRHGLDPNMLSAVRTPDGLISFDPAHAVRPAEATQFPQDAALATAQRNGVGMLGLPENHTPMDRARALGFDTDAVHFSRHGIDATELDSGKYAVAPFDAIGTHVGTIESARDRFRNTVGTTDQAKGSSYPVLIRRGDEFISPNGGAWNEDALNAALIERGGYENARETYQSLNAKLRKDLFKGSGYDSIPYVNDVEGKGSLSHIVPPWNIRSRFAAFDPARRNESDLLASFAGAGILSPLVLEQLAEPRDKKDMKRK